MSDERQLPSQDRGPARDALADLLASAATGQFPPPDGSVDVLAQPSDRDAGVISFTGYAVIFADTDPDWVSAQLPPGDLSGPLSPGFLHALSQRLGRHAHSVDMLTCATRAGRAAAQTSGWSN